MAGHFFGLGAKRPYDCVYCSRKQDKLPLEGRVHLPLDQFPMWASRGAFRDSWVMMVATFATPQIRVSQTEASDEFPRWDGVKDAQFPSIPLIAFGTICERNVLESHLTIVIDRFDQQREILTE